MERNELFSGLVRAAVHSSGEMLYGLSFDARTASPRGPQPAVSDSEPGQPVQEPTRDIDVDIHGWLKHRDHVLGY